MFKEKGFTLMEIMVAVAAASVVGLIIATVFALVSDRYASTHDALDAQSEAAKAELLFKLALSQAINVNAAVPGNVVAAAIGGATPQGQILGDAAHNYSFSFLTMAASAAWTTIAAFNREVSGGVGGAPPSSARTFIWYQAPTAKTCGVLYFYMQDPNGMNPAAGAGGPFSPDYTGPYVARISGLELTKHINTAYNQVTSVDVHLRFRYFNSMANGTNWCPAADIGLATAGCTTKSNWSDLDRRFTVLLRNNLVHDASNGADLIATGSSQIETVMGSLYFFNPYFSAN